MVRNVGSIDRTIRIAVGLFFLSSMFWGPNTWWGLIGIIPLYTGVVGMCMPYTFLGINTCKERREAQTSTES